MLKKIFIISLIILITIISNYLTGFSAQKSDHKISPVFETRPTFDDENFDADDPAIWVNKENRNDSLVICTLKKGGLDVYNLNGKLLQYIKAEGPANNNTENKAGRYNNVDIIYGLKLGKKEVDLAVVSDRGYDKLRIFLINQNKKTNDNNYITEITAPDQPWIFSNTQEEVNNKKTAYGLAVTQPIHRKKHAIAFVSQNDTTSIAKIQLHGTADGKIGYTLLSEFDLPENFILPNGDCWSPFHDDSEEKSHIEGMVVDDENNTLFLAQEQIGIWKTSITNSKCNLELIDKVNEYGVPYERLWDEEEEEYTCERLWDEDKNYGSDYLSEDVEGLTIYNCGNKNGYLMASSQGSNTFVVYDKVSNDYISEFKIESSKNIDGSQECDGIHVTNMNLGNKFPNGLLVTQDGDNTPKYLDKNGESRISTNFKFVDWKDIASKFNLTINNK
ncbi:MAG: phytase [Clostridiales bacterium]